MFCPKCGTNLVGNEDFCPKCGENIKVIREQQNINITQQSISNNQTNIPPTMTDALSKKVKEFIIKYKKIELITLISTFSIIFLLVLYNILFGFETLKWDKSYSDIELNNVTNTTIELGIKFSNEEKLNDIKYKVTCGEVEQDGLKFNWDLSDSVGECKITIKHKLKRITKKFTVINNDNDTTLALKHEIDKDSDEDLDSDGLTNKEETSYKTDPELSDTDMDGLDDYYELFTSKTDPNKKDSDNDGINDYDEIELGLDPLKSDSKGDGVKDSERSLSYNIDDTQIGVNLTVNGKGNISSTTITKFNNSTFENTEGLLGTVYNFYTDGTLNNATVKIQYKLDEITSKNLNEDNLSLYYFDEDTKLLEKIETTVDKENKTLSATLTHFSKYVIGDSNAVLTDMTSNVLFVIDNSVSMYSESQMIAAGYDNSTGAIGNDTQFKRLTLTNEMVDMFTGNYKFAVSEFSDNYVKLNEFTDSTSDVKKAVNSMKSNWNSNANGTNIIEALNSGIKEFKSDDNNHYIILLTDGKNTEGDLSDEKDTIISNANKNDVKICVIGLGTEIDTDDLDEIAEATNCDYYNASNSSALEEIYSIVGADINYGQVSTSESNKNKVNGTVLADSGFIVTRDGFSFKNYSTTQESSGHCYGMATFAELYYINKLPLKLGIKTFTYKALGTTIISYSSYAYDLTNTYFATNKNLYDFKFDSNILKYTFDSVYDGDIPADLYTVKNNTLLYSNTYLEEIKNSKIYDKEIYTTTLTKSQQIEKHGTAYSTEEKYLLNEDKMQNSSLMKKVDVQLLNALYAAFIKQNKTEQYYSAAEKSIILADIVQLREYKYKSSAKFINLLKERLESGDVPVIGITLDIGGHAINAISLVQDNKDANHYYIGVYDNNYPGEKRYVDVQCTKFTCVSVSNDYYTTDNKPITISTSLEEDLNYYK